MGILLLFFLVYFTWWKLISVIGNTKKIDHLVIDIASSQAMGINNLVNGWLPSHISEVLSLYTYLVCVVYGRKTRHRYMWNSVWGESQRVDYVFQRQKYADVRKCLATITILDALICCISWSEFIVAHTHIRYIRQRFSSRSMTENGIFCIVS